MSRLTKKPELIRSDAPPLSPLQKPIKPLGAMATVLLTLLVLAYVALAAFHITRVPTGATGYQNAPDEYAHVLYVKAVAEGHFPTPAEYAAESRAYEWHQPPLYYLVASRFIGLGERNLRFVSVGLGIIALLLIFRAGRLLFPGSLSIPFLATGIAAFTPTHIALSSVVNNDILLEVGFSWALLLCVSSLLSGFTMWRAGWLGLAVGMACLTKANGLLLLPVFLFVLFLLRKSGESTKNLCRFGAWTLTVAFAVCGWWFIRNGILYGEFLPFRAFARMFEHTVLAQNVVDGKVIQGVKGWGGYAQLIAQWTYQSFFAVFGDSRFPRAVEQGVPFFLAPQIYGLVGIGLLIAVYGLTRMHFEAKTNTTPTQRFALWVLFFVLGLVTLSFIAFVLKYFQATGRYLFPAMLPISLLLAAGYERAIRGKYRGLLLAYGILTYAALCATFFLSLR